MKLISVISLCLQHCLHQIHLDRKRLFLYEFSVEKLVFLNFCGYFVEIESEKTKPLNFCTFFFFDRAVLCRGQ